MNMYSQKGRSPDTGSLPGSYHGSGCTLPAIAATIANGLDISEVVRDAQEHLANVEHAYRPGWANTSPIACSADEDQNDD